MRGALGETRVKDFAGAAPVAAYICAMSLQGGPESVSVPLVSVAITAFNSEKWLARAIDSVLLQRTDFELEIVIADDFSSDGTAAVACAYRDRHPGRIRILGMQRNYYEMFEECRGKYIAWLDADDYWTDPAKLAVQIQGMESDPSISASGHYVGVVSTTDDILRERYPSVAPGRYGLADIVRQNFLPSASIVFRNGIHRDLPASFFDLAGLTDWPILVQAALVGDIVLIDRVMAVYMLSSGSAYMSKSTVYQETVDVQFCEQMENFLPSRWRGLARAAKGKRYESMAYVLREQGKFTAAREAAIKAFRSPDLTDNVGSKFRGLVAAVLFEAGAKLGVVRAAS
jgi:glycosyltransferase involved in cell wall biosynthesis